MLREHLETVAKAIGKKPKELEDLVELPSNFNEVWDWFLALNNTRSSGFGISAITYTEIRSFFQLMQIDVQPWEIRVIKMLDSIALEISNEKHQKDQKKNKK